ncbi:MAG: hypothetical protein RIC15_08230 [Vicingaceae bacterium]
MKGNSSLFLFGVLSIAMALAPFRPEPHLWGKIQWIAGGAVGMTFTDWFDVVVHAGPISIFLFTIGMKLGRKRMP